MKKIVISRLFLYKHRFIIGYILLAAIFFTLLFLMPTISPDGLSDAEMASAVTSNELSVDSVLHGNFVDLPYHLLQKLSISIFGLNAYAIKLPSIIFGIVLGLLLILLLNRWFKNNVAIIGSVMTVISAPFLYIAGSGTPTICLVFWPTLLLWLGSKIQGEKKPKISYCFLFGFFLLFAIFTPHLIYLAGFILIFVLTQPHLRFTIKSLPRKPFIAVVVISVLALGFLVFSFLRFHGTARELLWTDNFGNFFGNIKEAFLPFFSWTGNAVSTMLSPMIGLASLSVAIAGLISTAKGFFASRNSIATMLILFTIFISGLSPNSAVLIILPLAILTSHGIRYILEKWYGLFPENPYARVAGFIPIATFIGIILISSMEYYVFGYRYNLTVANEFQDDLGLIYQHLEDDTTLLIPKDNPSYDFYKILEGRSTFKVASSLEGVEGTIATLGRLDAVEKDRHLYRIITSPKSLDSDRIYVYKK
ncbi:MAG: glycosyltransferase family 39 protein [Candidatus Saccharibacteria bacterium]|nr:glycosyltransferase family 39 protein [Candidatus Saccharibacteria bacterium]